MIQYPCVGAPLPPTPPLLTQADSRKATLQGACITPLMLARFKRQVNYFIISALLIRYNPCSGMCDAGPRGHLGLEPTANS
jgi:hypothetical protein